MKDKEKLFKTFGHSFILLLFPMFWGYYSKYLTHYHVLKHFPVLRSRSFTIYLFNPLKLSCKRWYSLFHQLWTSHLLCTIYWNYVIATIRFTYFVTCELSMDVSVFCRGLCSVPSVCTSTFNPITVLICYSSFITSTEIRLYKVSLLFCSRWLQIWRSLVTPNKF